MGLKIELPNGDTWNFPDKGLSSLCRLISEWYDTKKEQEEKTLPEPSSSAPNNNVLNNKTL